MSIAGAGSIDIGIAEAARVTATANSEEAVEAGLFTATVTSDTQPASDTPTVTEFMSAVVAWPGPNEPGYVNLHYSTVDRKNPSGPLRKGS